MVKKRGTVQFVLLQCQEPATKLRNKLLRGGDMFDFHYYHWGEKIAKLINYF